VNSDLGSGKLFRKVAEKVFEMKHLQKFNVNAK